MTRRLILERSGLALLNELLLAAVIAAFPFVLFAGVWVLSLMTWSSGPHLADLLWLIVPCLLLSGWIAYTAFARGSVEIGAAEVVVRHTRMLRRPLRVARAHVRAVMLDEGWSGNARFPTADPAAPFLWAARRTERQDRRRPLIGDAKLPNLALILDPPRVIREARCPISALATPRDPSPPSRRIPAETLFLTVEDPAAARAAFATWPLDDARDREPLPELLREPARPAPEILVGFAITAAVVLTGQAYGLWWLMPLAFIAVIPLVARGVHRNRRNTSRAHQLAGAGPHAHAAARAKHRVTPHVEPTRQSQTPPTA